MGKVRLADRCEVCKENCTKHCERHIGRNMALFIQNLDVTETHIGDVIYKDRLTSGFQLTAENSKCDLAFTSRNKVKNSGKFKAVFNENKDLKTLMNEALKAYNVDEEIANGILEKYTKFEENKLVSNIFTINEDCMVTPEDKRKSFVHGKVNFITWQLDNNGELHIRYGVKTSNLAQALTTKVHIENFGSNIRKTSGDKSLGSTANTKVLKPTSFGVFRPAVLRYVDEFIAFDNQCIYYGKDESDDVLIIGVWGNDQNKFIETPEYSKIKRKITLNRELKNNLDYIYANRKFIAPYGTLEENTIMIGGGR